METTQRGRQRFEVPAGDVAAGQWRRRGPRRTQRAEVRLQLFERLLRKDPVGRELAADDRQRRREAGWGVEVERVVACHGRGARRSVVLQGADAGKAPDDVAGPDRPIEAAIHHVAQVLRFDGLDGGRAGLAGPGHVGRADQREIVEIGNHEHDAPVRVLQRIGVVALVQPRHDDVAALHEAQRPCAGPTEPAREHFADPRACRVDDGARDDRVGMRIGIRFVADLRVPCLAVARRAHEAMADANVGAALGRVFRVQDDEAAVVGRAIRIGEAEAQVRAQGRAIRRLRKVRAFRGGERAAAAHPVVQEEPETHGPRGPEPAAVREHEAAALDEVWRDRKQPLALRQRLPHEAQVEVLEVAQAAVQQLAGGGGRVMREAVLLDQQHGEAAAGRVTRDAGAVDSAADDEQVVAQVVHPAVAMTEG